VRRAIREHLRDFVAIVTLLVLGLAATVAILSQQQAVYPSWIPFLGDDRFELKAEFTSAQAVTPGQGQTVNMAGVEVGDVTKVELEDETAVVTLSIEERYADLIHENASLLMRPRTGLQDITVEVDTGTESAAAVSEGDTIPVSQTQPNVQPDEILATLDGDTQAYLKLLLEGGARGLGGHGKQLSAGLRRLEPFARDVRKINGLLAKRRQNIRGAISSFRAVAEEVGRNDQQLAEFVDSSNAALGAFANQEAAIRRTLQEFPATLRETQRALRSSDRFSLASAPALRRLTPAARTLGPALEETRPFLRRTVGPIKQIRPFTRRVRKPFRHLRQAAQPLKQTTSGLEGGLRGLNQLFNALAFNPDGPQEGYLFWLAWLNHNLNAISFVQDAHGPIARGIVEISCQAAVLAEQVASQDVTYETLLELTRIPTSEEVEALGGC
jgi:phospholipid/cholesterol/gamma-HCH transport system substrate-binding protein